MKIKEKITRSVRSARPDRREKELRELGWEILELRYRYYILDGEGCPVDREYDRIEEEYRQLAKALGQEPTAITMIDFDTSRASCCMAAAKVNQQVKRLYGGKWPDHLHRPPYEVILYEEGLVKSGIMKGPVRY